MITRTIPQVLNELGFGELNQRNPAPGQHLEAGLLLIPVVVWIQEIFTLALEFHSFNDSYVILISVLILGPANDRYIQLKQCTSARIAFRLLWLFPCGIKCLLVVSFNQKRHGNLLLPKYPETFVAPGQSAGTKNSSEHLALPPIPTNQIYSTFRTYYVSYNRKEKRFKIVGIVTFWNERRYQFVASHVTVCKVKVHDIEHCWPTRLVNRTRFE